MRILLTVFFYIIILFLLPFFDIYIPLFIYGIYFLIWVVILIHIKIKEQKSMPFPIFACLIIFIITFDIIFLLPLPIGKDGRNQKIDNIANTMEELIYDPSEFFFGIP